MIVKQFFACFIVMMLFHGTVVMAEEKTMWFSSGKGAMSGSVNIAEAKGFFIERGINGKVKKFQKGKIAFDNYLSGQVDFATTNIISIVLTNFDLSKHRLIATLAYTDNEIKVLAKKSSGITTPANLKGKKIATTVATTGHFYLYKFLTLNGISASEVEIVFMNNKQISKALIDGDVDAICQHGMVIENAKRDLKDDWVIFQEGSIHRKPVSLIVPQKWLNENSEKAKDILSAILKADQFIQTNTEASIRIIAKAKGYSFEAMNEAVRNEINYDLSLRQELYNSLEQMEEWAIKNNLVQRKVARDYNNFVSHGPLDSLFKNK